MDRLSEMLSMYGFYTASLGKQNLQNWKRSRRRCKIVGGENDGDNSDMQVAVFYFS